VGESGAFCVGYFLYGEDVFWRVEKLSGRDIESINVCKSSFLIGSDLSIHNTFSHGDKSCNLVWVQRSCIKDCAVGRVGYSQLYRGIQGFSSTGGSETPKLKELKPSFQRYRGLISAVLGPLGPRITIYIGTSHRRSNESSLKYNTI
jgi:hypothetical protein